MKDANSIHTINMNQAAKNIGPIAHASNREIALTEKQKILFWKNIEKTDGCWLWRGHRNKLGYGRMQVGDWRNNAWIAYAHRVSYAVNIEQPFSLLVLHKCDNPSCVNPAHLFIGTQEANMHDMDSKNRRVHAHGEKGGAAKMTNEKVLEMRALHANGKTRAEIGRLFGLGFTATDKIIKRETWKHI